MSEPQRRLLERHFWLKLHLYLGLTVGLVFVVAGLTGSLLVFYNELDEWLNSELVITEPVNQPWMDYEKILLALQKQFPERTKSWRFEIPRNDRVLLMARYYKPEETEHLHFAPLMVWINPYTAEIVRSRFWGQYLMTWLFDLHFNLLLDLTGKTIMAYLGGVLLISLLTGLYLWWPSFSKLKSALLIKRSASFVRFNYDLHKVNGVYSVVLLLLIVASGILLELPDFFNPVIHRFSPLFQAQPNLSTFTPGSVRLPVDRAVQIARMKFPQASLRWIETPNGSLGNYRIQLYQAGEPSQRFPKTMVWIDQYSGAILEIRNPTNQSPGDQFLSWLHPLHNGEIAGIAGRWLVFVLGFVPLILFITGVSRWRQKVRVQRFKAL